MKKIACVGYHYTGSGAVDDLFRECDNVYQGKYEAELRILHDPDGVSDLEFHLVENPSRLTSSLAIKRFLAYANHSYRMTRHIIGNDWFQIINKYVDSLILIQYPGYAPGDDHFFNMFQRNVDICGRIVNKLLPEILRMPKDSIQVPFTKTYYSRMTEQDFLQKTKVFVEELCHGINKDYKEFLVLDQFVEASNPTRYMRYADELKVIIVDRDPRDLYINRISKNDRILPKNPHDFCVYYRNIRMKSTEESPAHVMRINLEDMIYKYSESVKRIFDFVGMDPIHHTSPKKYFDPAVSIKGTKTWLAHPEYASAIKIIEERLQEYLYLY